MMSYIAHDTTSGMVSGGGLSTCLCWAFDRCAKKPESVVTIIKSRPGEDARVIAEVDKTGGRWIFGGRYIPRREVSKLTRRAASG